MRRAVLPSVVVALAALPGAAAGKEKPGGGAPAPYVHVVIFHLKKDAPKAAADAIVKDSRELLAKVPSVRQLRVGRPAPKATEIAKKDYQVGLMILFDDYDGLKTYLDHPKHLEFVKRHTKNIDMTELRVFDFADQKE